jgi:magnesium transporter
MIKTIQYRGLSWIDIEDPDSQDILFLKEKYNLHPLLLEEFTTPSQRPRAEEFEDFLYLVIHIPLFDRKTRTTSAGELDILLTRNSVVTGHLSGNLPLHFLFKEVAENPSAQEVALGKSPGFLLYYILEKLLSSCFPKIDHISEKLSEIERKIFEGYEKEMVREISIVKRDILAFRRTLKPQRSILESLSHHKKYKALEGDLEQYLQDLIGTNIRVWNALENTKEVIESLEETNNSLVSYNINEAMRFLTAISLITFSLSVTTGIFSMLPFSGFEIATKKDAFWLILLFMALITTGLLFFFKRKRWL